MKKYKNEKKYLRQDFIKENSPVKKMRMNIRLYY